MLMRFGDFDRTFSAIDEFRRRMDRLMDDFNRGGMTRMTQWPHTTLFDNGESFVIRADVPGMDKDALTLSVQQNLLTISGERVPKTPEGYSVHRQERGTYRFSRSFTLPAEVNAEKVSAQITDGVLLVTLPKSPAAMPRQISIQAR
jgi:HSP20 family protein